MNQQTEHQAAVSMRRLEKILFAMILIFICIIIGLGFFVDSRLDQVEINSLSQQSQESGELDTEIEGMLNQPVQGQVVYVPAYSHVYQRAGKRHELAITLSIRNTDLENEVILKSVRYYNTQGKEVKSYLLNPKRIGPLATEEIVIERQDTTGGSGANFIVEWVSGVPVSEPLIEAVMIDTSSTQGISFICEGKVIKEIESVKK